MHKLHRLGCGTKMMGDAFMFGVFGWVIGAQAIADKHFAKIIAEKHRLQLMS